MDSEKGALQSGVRSLVKNLNRSVVLDLLRRDGPLSRTEIAKRTGISLPVISRLMNTLIDERRVLEVGKAESSGGRRRTLLGYNFAFGKVIGVDIGAYKTAIGLTDLSGSILFHRRVPTESFYAGGKLVESLAREIEDVVQESGIDSDELVGVGVGVPGIVRNGTILEAPGLKLSDDERAIESILGRILGLPVWVDNDANTTALGEHWKGELKGTQHAMCVAIGTGIGVGILAGGKLYRGAHGAAGEIGYWVFENTPGLAKNSHRYGYLESMAAGPGIQRRALAAVRAHPTSILAELVAQRVPYDGGHNDTGQHVRQNDGRDDPSRDDRRLDGIGPENGSVGVGRGAVQGTVQGVDRGAGLGASRDAGQSAGQGAGQGAGRNAGQDGRQGPGQAAGGDVGQNVGHDVGQNTGGAWMRSTAGVHAAGTPEQMSTAAPPALRESGEFSPAALALTGENEQVPPTILAATDVFAAAEQGDPVALEVVRETTDLLGVALGNAAALLDPEVIVITGGVSRVGKLLLEPIAETISRIAPYPPRVVLSTLQEEATILGAVWGVLHRNESSLKINVL